MLETRIILDRAALKHVLSGPDGPVYRDLAQKGLRVQQEARRLVSGDLLNVRTGRGRAGITSKMAEINGGPVAIVSTSLTTPYMAMLHFGTRYITARPFLTRALNILRK